ncbi:MAG: hypothetical protein AAFY71_07825 [Bacteroidota bacterium]
MNVEGVYSEIIETGHRVIMVYYGHSTHGKQPCFSSLDRIDNFEEISKESAAEMFQNFMSKADPGAYTAKLKPAPSATTATKVIKFMKRAESQGHGGELQVESAIGNLASQMEAKFEAKLEQFKTEQRLAEKDREISELKKDLEDAKSGMGKFSFFADKLVERMIEKNLFGADVSSGSTVPPAPVSTANISGPEISEEETDEATEAITEHVQMIANKIEMKTIPLMEKLSRIEPEQLQKLADLDERVIQMLVSKL